MFLAWVVCHVSCGQGAVHQRWPMVAALEDWPMVPWGFSVKHAHSGRLAHGAMAGDADKVMLVRMAVD